MERPESEPGYIPSSTYRLQFNSSFTFEMAAGLVDYLDRLGITCAYASPFLMARPGSLHGYDITDHSKLNPEIGSEASFAVFSGELKKHGMGLVADIVPNHMCVYHPSNAWWWDVLENGPSSPFARFFDIEWLPPKPELANRVLLPVLGEQYGKFLESQGIRIVYSGGAFAALVYEMPLPLAPLTWTAILRPAVSSLRAKLSESDPQVRELESIVTALGHLPGLTETDEAKMQERQREKEILKKRLSVLVDESSPAKLAIEQALAEINGQHGEPGSFDRLEALMERQAYRLSYWRVAADEINYRRFFYVNDLAAIRVEDPTVFAPVHALILDFVRQGRLSGLRVDHPDGLADPGKYFRYLQDACGSSIYVVAEKILTGDEPLPAGWAVDGTTGYDFLNLANGLFVDRTKEKAFHQLYRRFTGWAAAFDNLACDGKRLILQTAQSSELNVLARKLDHISEQHRWYRDFTLENLREALREVLAAFPVYRTYIREGNGQADPEDRRQISIAISQAKRRNPAIDESVFDFIQSVLLLEHPEGLDEAQRGERGMFATRFQQLSASVMAKGVEDTAFYRYFPLASLNEVGGDPQRFGVSLSAFHRRNLFRQKNWPNGMNATSTHDTKRGEDVRARINALSEIPGEWHRTIRRWREMNRECRTKTANGALPGVHEEYLFYQTVVGTWPLVSMNEREHGEYVGRIQAYMEKAAREAKIHTSWISPNIEYERCLRRFVDGALMRSSGNAFLDDFCRFHVLISRAGVWNSISQVLLKIASPGVPDFYQGNELWCFDLVDPDNRRPVDFERRGRMLSQLDAEAESDRATLMERMAANPEDGALKLYFTSRALRYRRAHRELFSRGSYIPLAASGSRANRVAAFARASAREAVVLLTGRFFTGLGNSHQSLVGEAWADTVLTLPRNMKQAGFRDVFSGRAIPVEQRDGASVIRLLEAFSLCPAALLASFDAPVEAE